jgi:hypothetical protein
MVRRRPERTFLSIDEAAPHVARIVQPILLAHASAPIEVRNYYNYLLKWAINGLDQFVRPEASHAAMAEAAKMGLGDIRDYIWLDQTSKMKDPGRKIFHWEHIAPVSDLMKACLACPPESIGDIEAVLRRVKIAWILKSENKQLKNHGRGDDPLEFYRLAKIELVDDEAGRDR